MVSYDIPFGISAYTYQEMLQGARSEKDFLTLKNYLGGQKIYILPETIETYEKPKPWQNCILMHVVVVSRREI